MSDTAIWDKINAMCEVINQHSKTLKLFAEKSKEIDSLKEKIAQLETPKFNKKQTDDYAQSGLDSLFDIFKMKK